MTGVVKLLFLCFGRDDNALWNCFY